MDSEYRLVMQGMAGQERAFALSGGQVNIGRATNNDIVLHDARASRNHARLDWQEGRWALHDLGSANGVLVNGERRDSAALQPGDLIVIGETALRFEQQQAQPGSEVGRIDSEAELEATLAGATIMATLQSAAAPHLAVHAGGRTWTVDLAGETLGIGRQGDNDLILDLERVSRHHARIERQGDRFLIRDLESTNGTVVSGERIETEVLQNGDVIRIGGAQILFKQPAAGHDLTVVDQPGPRFRRRPVVIVPGLMGSQLWLGNERVWPSVRRLFAEPDLYRWPNDAGLEARGIVDEVVIVPNLLEQEQYGRLSAFLQESLGYRLGDDLMEFAYDWRQDVRASARRLAQAIDTWGVQPPVIIIAHSLGCLVSRYYVERLGGKDKVARLLLMGGPHYGAPKVVANLFSEVDLLPFGLMGERLRGVLSTFPSSYQILPTHPCVHDQNGEVFDVLRDDSWLPEAQRPLLGLARQFRQELGDVTSVPTVSIFGYGLKTTTGIEIVRAGDGAWRSLHMVQEKEGDVTVPEWSTVLEGSDVHPVEQAHGALYTDNDVKMRLKLELMR